MTGPATKTLAKSLRLLQAFTLERPSLTAAELARHAGLPVSSVYRFLATFRDFGLIEPDGAPGRFRAGLGLLEMARTVLGGLDIRRVALRPLQELRAATNATAFLTVLRGDRAVCVEVVESVAAVRLCQDVGESRPLHAGAPARVLLAFQAPETVEAVLAQGLPRVTDRTLTDPEILRRRLAAIRARGYAVTAGEFIPNACAVAVPVRGAEGRVTASLALAAPVQQLSLARAAALAPMLEARAAEISAALGYRGPDPSASARRISPVRDRFTRPPGGRRRATLI